MRALPSPGALAPPSYVRGAASEASRFKHEVSLSTDALSSSSRRSWTRSVTSLRHPTTPATVPAASVSARRLRSQTRSAPACEQDSGRAEHRSGSRRRRPAGRRRHDGERGLEDGPVRGDDRRSSTPPPCSSTRRPTMVCMRSLVNATWPAMSTSNRPTGTDSDNLLNSCSRDRSRDISASASFCAVMSRTSRQILFVAPFGSGDRSDSPLEPPETGGNLEGVLPDLGPASLEDGARDLLQPEPHVLADHLGVRPAEQLVPGRYEQGVVGGPDPEIGAVLV